MELAVERSTPDAPLLAHSPTATSPWLASRLLHRQVVNAATLEPLGRVADVVFDPERCQLVALDVRTQPVDDGLGTTMRRALGQRKGVVSVALDHIVALSGDVVIVNLEPARLAPGATKRILTWRQEKKLVHRLEEVCDLTILTLHGLCLGSLTDILLDHRGSAVLGYVVRPTAVAEQLLLPFEGIELPASRPVGPAEVVDSQPVSEPEAPPQNTGLRLIPASPRVRVGESLILVMEDVEPLAPLPVAIASESGGWAGNPPGDGG